jgi:hypothetical protein
LDFKDLLSRGPLFLYNRDSVEGFGGGGHGQNCCPNAHHLSSSAYHLMVEYSRILTLYEAQHELLLKSHNFYWETQGPLTQEQQDQFEFIKRVKSEGMVHAAEKKCCPLKMGEVDFSPNVNTAKGQHFMWQMIVCK